MEICTVESRVVPCGRTGGQKGTRKLIFAFRNLVEAPENLTQLRIWQWAFVKRMMNRFL